MWLSSNQFIDVNDVTPTICDLLGVTPPTVFDGVPQMPMHGASFRAALSDAKAPPPRDRQVYELRGNRAIWHNGWKAVTLRSPSGNLGEGRPPGRPAADPRPRRWRGGEIAVGDLVSLGHPSLRPAPLTGISRNAHLDVKTPAGPGSDTSLHRLGDRGPMHRHPRTEERSMNADTVCAQQAQRRLRGETR
jgi:hypothetical protein